VFKVIRHNQGPIDPVQLGTDLLSWLVV